MNDLELLNKLPLEILLIDQDYNVVWMNETAKRSYSTYCEKCYKLTHNLDQPCFTYIGHLCPVKEMKDRRLDRYTVVHIHVVEGKESLVLVMAQRFSEELFLEIHLPLDKVLTAFEVGRLRPELLINSGPLAFFVWENKEGWPVKSVSKSVYDLTEYTQEEFLRGVIDYAKLIHPEDLQRFSEEVRLNTESKSDYWTHQPYRIITKSGKVKWVLDHTVSIKDDDKVLGYYGYVMDISEYYEKERLFFILAENDPNGVVLYDFEEDQMVYANKAILKTLRYEEKDILGKDAIRKLVHPTDWKKAQEIRQERLSGDRSLKKFNLKLVTKTGKVKMFKAISQVVRYMDKEYSLITFVDITEEKKRERKLYYLATTDRLTKLFNRYAGINFFENLIHQAERYGLVFSLIFLDIDNFKKLNDTLGHLVGDRVLSDVAKTIRKSIRKSDIAIRWGGEEFLVLLPNTKDPLPVAEKIRKKISELTYEGWGQITVSIGSTVYLPGDTIDYMLKRADQALYEAKRLGKNRVEIA